MAASIIPKLPMLSELDSKKHHTLYHYCTLDTLLSICGNKSFRLSDINTMNDYAEMHWAYRQFISSANKDIAEYSTEFLDFIDEFIGTMQLNTLPLIGCFSTERDVLSQWRAYAGDGEGVAIGFDSLTVKNLSVRCAPVEYEPERQVDYFRDLLAAAHVVWSIKEHSEKWFREFLFISAFDMCLMKNPAFSEEKEVRIVRATTVSRNGNIWSLHDAGGSGSDKVARRKQPIKFRSRAGGLIAHMDLPLGNSWRKCIKEVVLGPRSKCGGPEVSMALSSFGFEGFTVSSSSATYR